jgi:hypothetical protein
MNDPIVIVRPSAETQIRRRVRKQIDDQWEEMSLRAFVPHDPSCSDPVFCTNKNCFKPEADKIVSDSYTI